MVPSTRRASRLANPRVGVTCLGGNAVNEVPDPTSMADHGPAETRIEPALLGGRTEGVVGPEVVAPEPIPGDVEGRQ